MIVTFSEDPVLVYYSVSPSSDPWSKLPEQSRHDDDDSVLILMHGMIVVD
jgi:hypothetical protein